MLFGRDLRNSRPAFCFALALEMAIEYLPWLVASVTDCAKLSFLLALAFGCICRFAGMRYSVTYFLVCRVKRSELCWLYSSGTMVVF